MTPNDYEREIARLRKANWSLYELVSDVAQMKQERDDLHEAVEMLLVNAEAMIHDPGNTAKRRILESMIKTFRENVS